MKLRLNGINKIILLTALTVFLCVGNVLAQEITAIDFNGDLIGKVIPDGKVVSLDNRLIGNITADSLIIDASGKLIGGVVPQGIAIGNDNRLLGKVSNDGTVRLSTGKIIGKALPNGLVVDDKFDILGAVLFPGLIYSDEGQTVGRLTGDGTYANLQGQNIGFVSPDGYAYRRSGNDYTLDGRLISSKMVVDSAGHFIGSVSPGGKITDFEGKQIGFIKANGFAYNSDNKVIGSIVRSGYAFDVSGKYIGLVTFNGEVINNEKLVGYLQFDGSVANSKGEAIGFMVDISATAADGAGKYLGRIMPEGKIARGRNIIGQIGPWNVVYDGEGRQIGKIVTSGPIFDYRGNLKAHALKNGQVIMPGGTPLGTMRNDFAVNTAGNIIGKPLSYKVVIGDNNHVLGVSGINSSLSISEDRRIISPFGYVYNPEGGVDGNAVSLGQVYNLGGVSLGSVSPNGEIIDKGAVQSGQITQYGFNINEQNAVLGKHLDVAYAVSSTGENLGILADGNQVLNKNLKPIGKILPDNSVVSWSESSSYMPVNGRASSAQLALGYDGKMLGVVDNQGQVKDAGATTIGRVSARGIIFDNSGSNFGEPVGFMTVINGKCEFVGVVSPSGDVRNYREVNMGKILPNNQAVSESGSVIGFGVTPGSVIDFGGKTIGTVTSNGKVLNYAGDNLGCVDIRNRVYNQQNALIGKIVPITSVIDFGGKIIGRSMLDGSVVNSGNQEIGYVSPDDSVKSKTSSPLGMLFQYRYAFDNNNKMLGTVNYAGEVNNAQGKKVGTVDFDGNVTSGNNNIGYALYDLYAYDNENNAIGYIAPDGNVISFSNQRLGRVVRGFTIDNSRKLLARGNRDFHIRDKEKNIIGELQLNGKVVSYDGRQIGTLGISGNIIGTEEQVIATATPLQYYEAEKKQPVYGADGNVVGYVDDNKQIVDENGNFIGQLEKDGQAVGNDGTLLGNTEIDWFKSPDKKRPTGALPEVGSIEFKNDEYKRSINIALTPDGEFLGNILDDGSVIDKNGNKIGSLQGDLVVDKEGDLIGIADTGQKDGKGGSGFVPGGFGDGTPHGTGEHVPIPPEEDPSISQHIPGIIAQQQARRQNMVVGKISSGYSREDFDGKQKDWGLPKVISTLPVDMDMMILADKPIPAVISRPIDTEHEAPVTAYVERNVYAEDGRNIVIPAGSHLIGSAGGNNGGNEGEMASARIQVRWERLILPNGVMFKMSSAQTGDAQGRGGVLGYLDRQLVKKYSLPLATSLITNGIGILFSTDDDSEGGENSTETSKQQAMNDAREGFLNDTKQMFQNILNERMQIQPITFVPAGTRIIVFPKVDLWLRTIDNASEGTGVADLEKTEDILVDDAKTSAYSNYLKERRNNSVGVSSATYSPEDSGVEPVALVNENVPAQRNRNTLPPPPPPSSGVINTTSQPPANTNKNDNSSDVPQLF